MGEAAVAPPSAAVRADRGDNQPNDVGAQPAAPASGDCPRHHAERNKDAVNRSHPRPLTVDDAPACDAIIASLPYFFGDPGGVRDCAAAVRSQRGYVATADGAVAAFLTVEQHDPLSAEITWTAA